MHHHMYAKYIPLSESVVYMYVLHVLLRHMCMCVYVILHLFCCFPVGHRPTVGGYQPPVVGGGSSARLPAVRTPSSHFFDLSILK